MFIDLLSESCEERGNFSIAEYWITKMSQYFEDMSIQNYNDY